MWLGQVTLQGLWGTAQNRLSQKKEVKRLLIPTHCEPKPAHRALAPQHTYPGKNHWCLRDIYWNVLENWGSGSGSYRNFEFFAEVSLYGFYRPHPLVTRAPLEYEQTLWHSNHIIWQSRWGPLCGEVMLWEILSCCCCFDTGSHSKTHTPWTHGNHLVSTSHAPGL